MIAVLVATLGFPAGIAVGLRLRRQQIRVALDKRFWAEWRALCAQAAANKLGWPERLP